MAAAEARLQGREAGAAADRARLEEDRRALVNQTAALTTRAALLAPHLQQASAAACDVSAVVLRCAVSVE
jgi:hypothetical protein